jgi:hypothetical protein
MKENAWLAKSTAVISANITIPINVTLASLAYILHKIQLSVYKKFVILKIPLAPAILMIFSYKVNVISVMCKVVIFVNTIIPTNAIIVIQDLF